jgi:hypothetical protein
MACGCQGQQAVSPSERNAERAALRETRLQQRAARQVETNMSAPTRFWNGPKGKSAS